MNGLAHNDIKPQNIGFTPENAFELFDLDLTLKIGEKL